MSHSPNSQDDYLRNLILNKGFDISDLLYTTSEGKEIKKIYQDKVDLLLEEQATKEELLNEQVGEYRIIHFACHSLIDNLFPNQSILLLSSSDPKGDFGFLDVKDIIALNIHAELVILSACQTGRGLITSEGIYGFTRA
ncbi:CHAT domain-containing protein, partial [Acidobacteriota bacterium]